MGAGQTQAVTANQLKHFADRLTEPQVFQLTTHALGSPKFRPVIPTRIGEYKEKVTPRQYNERS